MQFVADYHRISMKQQFARSSALALSTLQWIVPMTMQIVAPLHMISMDQQIARRSALCTTL
jgi:hypothetical protein